MELRKDYILDNYVIVAENRNKRPFDFKKTNNFKVTEPYDKNCPFCYGNESQTTVEIGRIEDKKNYPDYPWVMKWVKNLFPLVEENGKTEITTDNDFFTYANPVGEHYIVIETPKHNEFLWDFDGRRIGMLFRSFSQIILELNAKPETKYTLAFKNNGPEAGTSLEHSHSQVISFNHIPLRIKNEHVKFNEYKEKSGSCAFCDIIKKETNSYRSVSESENFISFTPYASRFPLEVWVFPKIHMKSITQLTSEKMEELGFFIKPILMKLKELNASYNFYIHDIANGADDFHFHIEICPRLSKFGGIELNETYANVISPEKAAEFYRGDINLKL